MKLKQVIPSYSRRCQIWQTTGSPREVVTSQVRELKQEVLSRLVPKLFSRPQVTIA